MKNLAIIFGAEILLVLAVWLFGGFEPQHLHTASVVLFFGPIVLGRLLRTQQKPGPRKIASDSEESKTS